MVEKLLGARNCCRGRDTEMSKIKTPGLRSSESTKKINSVEISVERDRLKKTFCDFGEVVQLSFIFLSF